MQRVGFYLAAAGALAGLVGTSFPEISRYASGVAFCCTGFSVWRHFFTCPSQPGNLSKMSNG
jgi:hypothetical protein